MAVATSIALGLGVAAIGAGSTIAGAKMQSGANKQAAQLEAAGVDKALQFEREERDYQRANAAPYLATGAGANSRLEGYLSNPFGMPTGAQVGGFAATPTGPGGIMGGVLPPGYGAGGVSTAPAGTVPAPAASAAVSPELMAGSRSPSLPGQYTGRTAQPRPGTPGAQIPGVPGSVVPASTAPPPGTPGAGTPEGFFADPSYAWRFNEGQRAGQASAAAQGSLLSGGTLKALQDRGQLAASQEYQNYFDRALQARRVNVGEQESAIERAMRAAGQSRAS